MKGAPRVIGSRDSVVTQELLAQVRMLKECLRGLTTNGSECWCIDWPEAEYRDEDEGEHEPACLIVRHAMDIR